MRRVPFLLILLVPVGTAQPSRYPESPRLTQLLAELPGNPNALERFWREVRDRGSPLIENLPGAPATVTVTFLLRGGAGLPFPVVFASVLPNNDPEKQRLLQLPGTDVWYRTYRFPRALPILYELSPNGPGNLQRDSLNRQNVPGPLGGSAAILPDVRNLEWSEKRNVAEGRVEQLQFRSGRLSNERTVRVYLPAGFHPGTLSDLLLMLDGDVYSGPVPLATILDNLIATHRIRPTAAVLIGNTDRAPELSCSAEFSAMLAAELLPWVDQRFGIRRDRDRTTIAGSSLGGLAAACAAWTQPATFGNVISLSGSFRWRPESDPEPEWLSRQLAASPRTSVRFFLAVGSEETATPSEPANPSLLTANRHLRDVLRAKGYSLVYREFPGAHDPLSWRTAIVDGLLAICRP
jgi:enterochelin esterase family protein